MPRVFISYSHAQFDWVSNRLAPLIRASGAELIRDIEQYVPGSCVDSAMNDWVDACDVMISVITPNYAASRNCMYEWARASERRRQNGGIQMVRVLLRDWDDKADRPPILELRERFYEDLTTDHYADSDDEAVNRAWEKILHAIGGDLGVKPLAWLHALTQTVKFVKNRQSVNLVASSPSKWEALIEELGRQVNMSAIVNMTDPGAQYGKRYFFGAVLSALGLAYSYPEHEERATIEFRNSILSYKGGRILAVVYFEKCGKWAGDQYGEFFDAMRFLTTPQFSNDAKIISVIHSTYPISNMNYHSQTSLWLMPEIRLEKIIIHG